MALDQVPHIGTQPSHHPQWYIFNSKYWSVLILICIKLLISVDIKVIHADLNGTLSSVHQKRLFKPLFGPESLPPINLGLLTSIVWLSCFSYGVLEKRNNKINLFGFNITASITTSIWTTTLLKLIDKTDWLGWVLTKLSGLPGIDLVPINFEHSA